MAAAPAKIETDGSTRGIPKADFVEDVGALMSKVDMTAQQLIEQADVQYNKVSSFRSRGGRLVGGWTARVPS
jgi:hypothetical protein